MLASIRAWILPRSSPSVQRSAGTPISPVPMTTIFMLRRPRSDREATGGQRHVAHVGSRLVGTAIRVERVLEDAAHQDPIVTGEAILGAVAVVHVEIDNRHPLQAVALQRVFRGDGHVVEEAEAHGFATGGMVPGGRTQQKAFSTSPLNTASVAATAAPGTVGKRIVLGGENDTGAKFVTP